MYYSHTLPVSDPEQQFLPDVAAVWSALLLRITEPERFLPGLAGCRILAADGPGIVRELDFGASKVIDRVTRSDQPGWLRFEAVQTGEHAGGSLQIDLETSGACVALRFTYQTTLSDGVPSDGVVPSEFVRAAYRASDLDTIAAIREHLQRNRVGDDDGAA